MMAIKEPLREEQTNAASGRGHAALEITHINGVFEPVHAETAGGDLLSAAVTQHDVTRTGQIPG
jgi:hypothetical protein